MATRMTLIFNRVLVSVAAVEPPPMVLAALTDG